MKSFYLTSILGDGYDKSYNINLKAKRASGNVLRAVDLRSGDFRAIKKIKQLYSSWAECAKLRELQV